MRTDTMKTDGHTHCLLLAGSSQARSFTQAFVQSFPNAHLTISHKGNLARIAPTPPHPTHNMREGGFGGIIGLCEFLRDNAITHIIDATHHHADQIHWHAKAAAQITNTPLLRLCYKLWNLPEDWLVARATDHALAMLTQSRFRRIYLALGAQRLPEFGTLAHRVAVISTADGAIVPAEFSHAVHQTIQNSQQGDDAAFMRSHGIDLLVARNSGIPTLWRKSLAAKNAGIPVMMLQPPLPPNSETMHDISDALCWINAHDK